MKPEFQIGQRVTFHDNAARWGTIVDVHENYQPEGTFYSWKVRLDRPDRGWDRYPWASPKDIRPLTVLDRLAEI